MSNNPEDELEQAFRQQTSLTEILNLINELSTQAASHLHKQKKRALAITILLVSITVFKKNYFLKLKIFKGGNGFIQSVLHSFLAFLTFGKLYLLQKKQPTSDNLHITQHNPKN